MKTSFTFTDSYGKQLHAVRWLPESVSPKAVVQISHGMAEHIERYSHVAKFLNRQGFAVFAHDHRGHGKTDPHQPGFVSEEDGFHLQVKNIYDFKNVIEDHVPGLPRFLLGHSMGSFLVQRYLQIYDDVPAGVIYSGSNGRPPALLSAGIFLASLLVKFYGSDAESPLLHKLTFGSYNRKFRPNRTGEDWLSRDQEMVDLYIDDPLCGFICSTSFYRHFFEGLKTLHAHKPFAGHDPNIPFLIVSGDTDPVSAMGKGVHDLEKRILSSGVKHVQKKLYPGARHEILNETNRDEVLTDIVEWMNSIIG